MLVSRVGSGLIEIIRYRKNKKTSLLINKFVQICCHWSEKNDINMISKKIIENKEFAYQQQMGQLYAEFPSRKLGTHGWICQLLRREEALAHPHQKTVPHVYSQYEQTEQSLLKVEEVNVNEACEIAHWLNLPPFFYTRRRTGFVKLDNPLQRDVLLTHEYRVAASRKGASYSLRPFDCGGGFHGVVGLCERAQGVRSCGDGFGSTVGKERRVGSDKCKRRREGRTSSGW